MNKRITSSDNSCELAQGVDRNRWVASAGQRLRTAKLAGGPNSLLSLSVLLTLGLFLLLNSCSSTAKEPDKEEEEVQETVYPSDVISVFEHWNLILGDGSNAGQAIDFEQEDFFYVANDEQGDWVVYKAPNAGDTHGTSNNTRTELAQLKKWSPLTDAKLTATLKVMNVSTTGDARVAASYSVVVGQIHSADGHENEPLKIFYKKFPGHTKGSVFGIMKSIQQVMIILEDGIIQALFGAMTFLL